jgi:hypothetical protein
VISHGIARIAEFLTTDNPHIIAYGFMSPVLRSIGETEVIDELRVIISDERSTTAYFYVFFTDETVDSRTSRLRF